MLAGVMASTAAGSFQIKGRSGRSGDSRFRRELNAIHIGSLGEEASRKIPFQARNDVR